MFTFLWRNQKHSASKILASLEPGCIRPIVEYMSKFVNTARDKCHFAIVSFVTTVTNLAVIEYIAC